MYTHPKSRHYRITRGYCLLLLLLGFITSCNSGNPITELFPVRVGNLYGYMDRTGKMVINAQYAQAGCFVDGLALTGTTGDRINWGFIDKTGKYFVLPSYTDASDFSEGIAFVVAENGEPTAIDRSGMKKFTVKDAEQVQNFHEGLAAYSVLSDNGEIWGFIDKDGKTRIEPKFASTGFFSGGLCPVMNDDGLWGYVNKEGAVTIAPTYDNVSPFYGGMAKVYVEDKWGVIDDKGKYILTPQFSNVDFDKDKILVSKDDKFGWMDKKGKMVIDYRFADAFPFGENKFAAIRLGEKWGYIDNTGNIIIEPQYDFAFGFDGDLAPVRLNNKVGLVNNSGKMVVSSAADDISMDYYLRFFAHTSAFNGVRTNNNSPKFIGYEWLLQFYHLQFEEAKIVSTEETRTLLGQFQGLTNMMPDSSKQQMMKVRIGIKDCKEEGDHAVVSYLTSDNPDKLQNLYLVKKEGAWLVQFSKNDAMAGSADTNDEGATDDNTNQ